MLSAPQVCAISINGQPRQVPSGQSVADLLLFLGVHPERVAVELNREIIRKRNWSSTVVPDGAQLEVVEFVGGG